MKGDDDRPHRLTGWASLIFAYLCCLLSLVTIVAAIWLLPLPPKVKIFLGLATCVLAAMFAFMAILTALVLRSSGGGTRAPSPRDENNANRKMHRFRPRD